MFESPDKLILGLLTGVVFGFLLQKGRVAKFEAIAGQFRLGDWTVVKTMGTAVVVGAIGVYALVAALGQGNYDALGGVLGLMVGSYLYAEASGVLSRSVEKWGDRGKLTLPELVVAPVRGFVLVFLRRYSP